MTTVTAHDIAVAYCDLIAQEIEPWYLKGIYKGEAYPDDYCDGNMLMEAAFTKLGVPVWDDAQEQMRDDAVELWNAAYDIAWDHTFLILEPLGAQ